MYTFHSLFLSRIIPFAFILSLCCSCVLSQAWEEMHPQNNVHAKQSYKTDSAYVTPENKLCTKGYMVKHKKTQKNTDSTLLYLTYSDLPLESGAGIPQTITLRGYDAVEKRIRRCSLNVQPEHSYYLYLSRNKNSFYEKDRERTHRFSQEASPAGKPFDTIIRRGLTVYDSAWIKNFEKEARPVSFVAIEGRDLQIYQWNSANQYWIKRSIYIIPHYSGNSKQWLMPLYNIMTVVFFIMDIVLFPLYVVLWCMELIDVSGIGGY